MMTLRQWRKKPQTISASWYLADIMEARGRQDLYLRQSPQRLKVLRDHALIESAVSSNRMEGVQIEASRLAAVMRSNTSPRDRDEEEIRGYRNVLNLIHSKGANLPFNEETILKLHYLSRGKTGDAGQYKKSGSNIIEHRPDGRVRIRFHTVSARRSPGSLHEMLELRKQCLEDRWIHPLIAIAGTNLDFLCIHLFRDGNGRVSRLLLLLDAYHQGLEVGRYVSVEKLIEENKARYYETLEQSSQGWHEGKHDPWFYIQHVLYLFKSASTEFERRLIDTAPPRGEKTDMIIRIVDQFDEPFRVSDIVRLAAGVSIDTIRLVLKSLKNKGQVECLGRGQTARWNKLGPSAPIR